MLVTINDMLKAAKNMAQSLCSGEVLDDKGYAIICILCLSSEEVVAVFRCGTSELATACMHTKNKKLEKLGITTSSNQASPGTTVETGITTGKSNINLSDHTLQLDKIEVLTRGLNFCPTTKIVPIGLVADTEEFIRPMGLREFFHKPQDVSSEPNETTNEPEQSTREIRNAILQLIIFTFDNQFFIKTHGTAMGTKFAPQYVNIFMHKFEQDLFSGQDFRPTLYTRYINDIFFLWIHGEESLKRLYSNIILAMDNSSESVSFLDTCISIKDGHFSISLYCKCMDNLTMLYFSSFYPKQVKEAITDGKALCIHRIYSDQEKHDGYLKILKDALIRTEYDAQLIDRQIRHAIVKNHNDLLGRQTQDTNCRIPLVVQYFPGAESLCYVLHRLHHVINDDEHLAKAIPTPPLLTFKQQPNHKQTIICSKIPSLQDNISHNMPQTHGNSCKTCQIIDMETTIT
eukprot:g36676.t1